MTSGERMVWAAEFVRMMAPFHSDAHRPLAEAAGRATAIVLAMRHVKERPDVDDDTAAMVDDMLGVPR